jgi:hypothetical protein
MSRRHVPPEALNARRALRDFVLIDGVFLATTLTLFAIRVELLLILLLGIPACAWLMADVGCWDMDEPALRWRRILGVVSLLLGVAIALGRDEFASPYYEDGRPRSPLPIAVLWCGLLATGVAAVSLTTWALRSLAQAKPEHPGSGGPPAPGPSQVPSPFVPRRERY